ncbi:MAG TPA: ATP-binding cassette domain-containing protein [Thiotrichaceae bacterium]|nr:ATP-binding cassette domain-containing protein [Thiotrichaceae bacterium]
MALLTLHNIQLGFGGPALLDKLDLSIEENERICLIGRNGAGKSTLLKVIEGELAIDSGERRLKAGIKVSKLAQDVPDDIDLSVYDVVASGLEKTGELLKEYHHLSLCTTHDDEWMNRLTIVQQQLEQNNGWDLSQQVETVLSKLSLPADSLFSDLSGGLKRRVLLAKALLQQPDILLLDEPTNHLDIEAIEWLEGFLKSFNGSIVFITHDRAFLRNMATRIIELDRGRLISFPGNYDQFLIRKEEMLQAEEAENARFDKRLEKEEIWIRQGIKARRTRNEGRVRALKQMRDERSQRRQRQGNANITIDVAQKTGKQVVKARNISFSYPNKPIVNNFSTTIRRGDKVAILGPNGVGKTTLLKVLLGKLEPQEGTIELGTNIELAYFDQLREALDPELSVRENLASGSDQVTVNGQSKHVISYLQDFLFTPDRIHSPVSTLSGGEKNRLLLARLFTRPANVLVMDEPTNDLDIETLELLEELLLDYTGTLLLISHDRNFVDHIATNTIAFEGTQIANYIGGYEDWVRQRQEKQKSKPTNKVKKPQKKATKPKDTEKESQLSYKERLELEALPAKIETLETQAKVIQAAMATADFYQQSQNEIKQAKGYLAKCEAELEQCYEDWEELERKA